MPSFIQKKIKERNLVDARNSADSLIYSTEKSLNEAGDKIDAGTKGEVENSISMLKTAMEGEDTEEIKRASEQLTKTSHKIAEVLYAQAAGSQGEQGAESDSSQKDTSKDEEVVDADFEEVKNDGK